MITQLLIAFLQNFERALTKNELMIRYVVLVILFLIYLWLLVLILRRWQKKRMKTIIALILSAVLVFEAAQVFPFLQGEKEVPLEYVCSVKTSYNIHNPENIFFQPWYTNWSVTGGFVGKESLEHSLYCDLTDVDLDDDYTYLFVYYYKDVRLFYSNWGESTADTGIVNPKKINAIWLGRLDRAGKATEKTIYIYRFPRKAIVPNATQGL